MLTSPCVTGEDPEAQSRAQAAQLVGWAQELWSPRAPPLTAHAHRPPWAGRWEIFRQRVMNARPLLSLLVLLLGEQEAGAGAPGAPLSPSPSLLIASGRAIDGHRAPAAESLPTAGRACARTPD